MAERTLLPSTRVSKFYVYIYRDPRPLKGLCPIYVGKGKLGRAEVHWKYGSENRILSAVLKKIRGAGLVPTVEIFAWFDNEAAAFAAECALIAEFGRRDQGAGTLANMTNGGDGAAGCVHSEKTCKLRSKSIRAAKERLAENPIWLAAQNLQRSELRKKAWQDPDIRQKYKDAINASKAVRSDKMKEFWADPKNKAAHGAKVGAITRAAWSDPEKRQKRSDAIRTAKQKQWADPEFREKHLEKLQAARMAAMADPVRRQKCIETMRLANKASWDNADTETSKRRKDALRPSQAKAVAAASAVRLARRLNKIPSDVSG